MVLVTEMIFIAIPVSFYLKRIIVNTHETASWENNGILKSFLLLKIFTSGTWQEFQYPEDTNLGENP